MEIRFYVKPMIFKVKCSCKFYAGIKSNYSPKWRWLVVGKHFARNLREFGVARSEELEVNQ